MRQTNPSEIARVLSTTKYDMFKSIDSNRGVIDKHVDQLVASIQENGSLMLPIIVNEKGEVIDGQHRLHAYSRLELPVPYIVADGYGIDQVKVLNINQKNWSLTDYIKSWATRGNEEYVKLLKFMDDYKLGTDVSIAILLGNTSVPSLAHRMSIRAGGFKVVKNGKDKADAIIRLTESNQWLVGHHLFMFSLLSIMEANDVSLGRLYAVIQNHGHTFKGKIGSLDAIKQLLQRHYNHGLGQANKRRFYIDKL